MNEVRIIAGQFRGRHIRFRPGATLRPTLDAVRETLFNWLMFKVRNADCLDAFAGSGALGLEALSRFANHVTFIEYDLESARQLKKNLTLLNIQDQATVLHEAAYRILSKPPERLYDLIFLDPPFNSDLLAQALKLIHEQGHLKNDGLIYFEADRSLDITSLIERKFSLHRHKALGEVQFGLLSLFNETEAHSTE